MKFLDALKSGKRFKHIGWYDNRWMTWEGASHLLISRKLIDSNEWQIEDTTKPEPKNKK